MDELGGRGPFMDADRGREICVEGRVGAGLLAPAEVGRVEEGGFENMEAESPEAMKSGLGFGSRVSVGAFLI